MAGTADARHPVGLAWKATILPLASIASKLSAGSSGVLIAIALPARLTSPKAIHRRARNDPRPVEEHFHGRRIRCPDQDAEQDVRERPPVGRGLVPVADQSERGARALAGQADRAPGHRPDEDLPEL